MASPAISFGALVTLKELTSTSPHFKEGASLRVTGKWNQFFISGLKGDETIQNRVLESMYRRILRAHDEKKSFRVIIVIPLLPGFQGGIDDAGAASVRAIMHWQYRTICRGENSILHNLHDLLGARMHDYISFYGLRSYGRLFDSGPVASSQVYVHSKVMIIDDCTVLIGSANINDRSLLGSRDSENQFFISGLKGDETIQNRVLESMYRRILRAHDEKKSFRVIIVIPLLPGFQGGIDDAGAASVRAIMHWQYRTICRGENSILHNLHDLLGARMHDYISFYGLRSYGRLFDSGPVASSQVYVHSKVMIIDDCTVLIGSANINDRSLLGSRDSEIGVLIEDKELVDSYMGGKPWKAGKFASSLRHSLWSEHLGLKAEELGQIIDPVIDSTYKDIWMATAKTNTMIYQDVISCIPNDLIQSRAALRESMTYWKQKLGHTTIDLGIAPMTLESYQDGNITEIDPMERLKSVKGHLVSFPLKFMCEEDLRPGYSESEYYASPQVFH